MKMNLSHETIKTHVKSMQTELNLCNNGGFWRMNSAPAGGRRRLCVGFFVLGHFPLLVHPILCYFRFGPYLLLKKKKKFSNGSRHFWAWVMGYKIEAYAFMLDLLVGHNIVLYFAN